MKICWSIWRKRDCEKKYGKTHSKSLCKAPKEFLCQVFSSSLFHSFEFTPHIPGSGTTPLSRRIRMCIFDGVNFLSNVHTINADWEKDNPKIWRFPDKVCLFFFKLLLISCIDRNVPTTYRRKFVRSSYPSRRLPPLPSLRTLCSFQEKSQIRSYGYGNWRTVLRMVQSAIFPTRFWRCQYDFRIRN